MLAKNPNKLNIDYSVFMKPSDPITIFRPFINDLVINNTGEKCLCLCRAHIMTYLN